MQHPREIEACHNVPFIVFQRLLDDALGDADRLVSCCLNRRSTLHSVSISVNGKTWSSAIDVSPGSSSILIRLPHAYK